MNEDVIYYNQQLWSYNDYQVSTSNCIVEKFVSKDKYSISPVRLKIDIKNFKLKISSCITLSHSDVFALVQKFKPFETKISSIVNQINSDQNYQETFSIKTKKYMLVTFLYRTEYSGACIRIVISDKDKSYLDSEKVYMSIYDFLSLMMIVGQFRSNYLQTSDSMISMIHSKDLSDKVCELNDKLTGYYTQFLSMNSIQKPITSRTDNLCSSEDNLLHMAKESEIETDSMILQKLISIEQKTSSSSSKMEEDFDPFSSEIHDTMGSYLKEEVSKIDLGLPPEREVVNRDPPNVEKAIVVKRTFTDTILLNDVTNLEMYLTNIINDDLPFNKLVDLIKTKMSFDPIQDVKSEDVNSLNYMISQFVKHHIKHSLENKVSLPVSVTPLLTGISTVNEDKISLSYDLLLYTIYYNQLKNVLKDKDYGIVSNKELICFSLKALSTPLIFDSLFSLDTAVIVSELSNRLRRYIETGTFDKLQSDILETKRITFNLSETVLKSEAERMINAIKLNKDKLTIQNGFSSFKILKLNYEDFQKNKLSEEQIKRIVTAEFNFRKNGKLNLTECGIVKFDDIPATISEKYGVIIKKYDNTNLKRYVKDVCKDNEKILKYCIEICDKVNHSYKDLKSVVVDYTIVPESVLKAIYSWDIEKDSKISDNYIYYCETIKKSSLTKDMIISMMMNQTEAVVDSTFTDSFFSAFDS